MGFGLTTAQAHTKTGAGEGNRTLVLSLEGFSSTIELHPQGVGRGSKAAKASTTTLHPLRPALTAKTGGGGRIRTFEGRAVRFTV